MRLSNVLAKIKELKQPVFQTRDIVAFLDQPLTNISKSLARLAEDKHLLHLYKGFWAIPELVSPFMLPSYLLAPYPCYISLQSALHYYSIIEQIPEIIYVVSCDRTKIFSTPIATISVHHMPPALFFGYQRLGSGPAQIATSEKALFDFLYLKPTKNRFFTKLPEFTLPKSFNRKLLLQWLTKVEPLSRRVMMENNLKSLGF